MRDRRGERGGDLLAHEEAAQSLGGLEETLCLVRVAAINLDHLVALDRLLQHVHQIAGRVLYAARHPAQPPRDRAHGEADRRSDEQRDERQLPVEVEQPAEQTDDGDRVAHQYGEHERRRAAHVGDVVCDLGEKRPGRVVVVEVRRQLEQPIEHRRAQIEHHAARDPVHEVRRDEGEDAAHKEDGDDRGGEEDRRRARSLRAEAVVEERLDHRREERLRSGGCDHAEDRQREHLRIWAHIREQARVKLARARRAHAASRARRS